MMQKNEIPQRYDALKQLAGDDEFNWFYLKYQQILSNGLYLNSFQEGLLGLNDQGIVLQVLHMDVFAYKEHVLLKSAYSNIEKVETSQRYLEISFKDEIDAESLTLSGPTILESEKTSPYPVAAPGVSDVKQIFRKNPFARISSPKEQKRLIAELEKQGVMVVRKYRGDLFLNAVYIAMLCFVAISLFYVAFG